MEPAERIIQLLTEIRDLLGGAKSTPNKKRASSKDAFDIWWSHYPKKEGKLKAADNYKKAVAYLKKMYPGVCPNSLLLDAAKRYAKSKKVQEGFICLPATWLNQGRYLDEVADEDKPRPKQMMTFELFRATVIKRSQSTGNRVPDEEDIMKAYQAYQAKEKKHGQDGNQS